MVLKCFLSLYLLFAYTVTKANTYSELDLKYKLRDFDSILEEIDDIEEDLDYKQNAKIFELKALALEEKKNFPEAIRIYQKLIKANYSKYIRYLKSKKEFKFPKRMFFYYLKTAELFVDYYIDLPESYSLSKRRGVRKKIRSYLAVVKKMDETNDSVAKVFDRMKQFDTHLRSLEYNRSYFVYTSIVSWQNFFKVSDGTREAKVLSTVIGNCLGGGASWSNIKYDWVMQGCYFSGKSTATTENQAITYEQAQVPVSGFLAEAGWMTKSFAEDVSLGIFLDILSQRGEWDTKGSFELSETDYTRAGYTLKTKWDVSSFSFLISAGRIFKNQSYLFQLQTSYNF